MSSLPTSLDALLHQLSEGRSFKYILFWGHQPNRDGTIGKACFSQWWPSSFVIQGVQYPTAEHYMMAEKARLFEDSATEQKILTAKSPGHAKRLGREVSGFSQSIWETERLAIVRRANIEKFGQNKALGAFLQGTSQRILVEASPPDKVWGIGLPAEDPNASRPAKWPGLNLLGFALMQARDHLN
jgi:ribA/ribD-fused uncharacterized protein